VDWQVGDIVTLRNRLWRVDAFSDDVLTASKIEGGDFGQRRFYFPFEDVRLADLSLPDPNKIGEPALNRLLIQSYRYSLLHGSAPLLSLQRSSVIPTQYQLVPVVMALNESNRVRMLIADDVGLGKTIEAGLIATELVARNLATRILVVCPKNLSEQWREALKYFFQLDARIISSVQRRSLERALPPGASPWEYYHHLIASVDYVKREEIKHQVYDVPWDLVIVDEAHQCAKPHQGGERQSISMDRYDFLRELAPKTKHLLLLTATPHNGYSDSYASLLDMLGCDLVGGPVHTPIIDRERARSHVCQRRRKDVEKWFTEHAQEEENPFPERMQKEVLVPLVFDDEKTVLERVERYGDKILETAEGGSWQIKTTARWTVLHLHKRALSSPAALRQSLKNRRDRIRLKIQDQEAGEDVSVTPALAKANALDDDFGDDDITDEEASRRIDRNVFGSLESHQNEVAVLEELIKLADRVTPAKDSKLLRLKDLLYDALKGYNPPKVIIFTRYKDTLDYLEREIPKRLPSSLADTRIVTVFGDLNEAQRDERLGIFQQLKSGILIATDCISEGINLQHMANQLIHYELPWNPNRLEQRNGRIDRYGQKEPKVSIQTLVMNDTLDAKILKVLVKKAQQIKEDYGFSPPFFGDDTNVLDIIRDAGLVLTPAQRTLINFAVESEQVPFDPLNKEVIEKIQSESFYGQSDIELAEVRERLKESEAAMGSHEQLEVFIRKGLLMLGCRIEDNNDVYKTIKITLSEVMVIPGVPPVIERATFDPRIALQRTGIDQLNAGHPVVRRVIELIRESVFEGGEIGYGRTASITTNAVSSVTLLYYFLVRFSVGQAPATIIEELLPIVCDLTGAQTLDREAASALSAAQPSPSSRTSEEISRHLEHSLKPETYAKSREQAFSNRLEELRSERKALKLKLMRDEPQEWLQGIDDVSLASSDMLSVVVYYPARSGGRA
jgi:superfamily II DNA or RNA helicase